MDAATGRVTTRNLAPATVSILGVVPTGKGMLVTTGDGGLVFLKPDGSALWRKNSIGDLVGSAALAGRRVAVVNRAGRVLFFDATSGSA